MPGAPGSQVTRLGHEWDDVVVTGHESMLNTATAGLRTSEDDCRTVPARATGPVAATGPEDSVDPGHRPRPRATATDNRLP